MATVAGPGKAYCKLGEGWKCVITKTTGPNAGEVFVTCGGDCTCIIDGAEGAKPVIERVEGNVEGGPVCECGEGWKCVISKVEGPESGKTFSDCAGNCTCVPKP